MQEQFSQRILQNDGLGRDYVPPILVLKQPEEVSLSKRAVFPALSSWGSFHVPQEQQHTLSRWVWADLPR